MKFTFRKSFLLSFTFIFTHLISPAQNFDSVLNNLATNYPQEKLYIQSDKSVYKPGETIWFKAYLFAGNTPSDLSRNLYSELLNEKGNIIQRNITPFYLSGSAASFELPADLADSVVLLRAYTRWMLNFDSSFQYIKTFPIINLNKKNTAVPELGSNSVLHFFPEGGDLIENIESVIAFKATDFRGYPVHATGNIVNSKGDILTTFKTQHDGMGIFKFTPEPNQAYTASWIDQEGTKHVTKLPVPKQHGIVLEVIQVPEGVKYTIKRGQAAEEEFPSVIIVAQAHQQLAYQATVKLRKSAIISSVIPTDNFYTGINQITVFTMDGKPLAERIIFINQQDYSFNVSLQTKVKSTEKKGKNEIEIEVPDSITSNLSIAVTDASVNTRNRFDPDIYTGLLLTSDIKGYVHNPGYYFSSTADSTQSHLDLLMLTNGWRRFAWDDVLAGKLPPLTNAAEDYLLYEGKILGLTKKELHEKELTLAVALKSGGQQVYVVPVEDSGKFIVAGLQIYDTATLFYQINKDKNKVLTDKAIFEIRNNLLTRAPKFYPSQRIGYQLPPSDAATVARNQLIANRQISTPENQKAKTLTGVTVTGRLKSKKERMNDDYTSGFFSTEDGYSFIPDDDPFAIGVQNVFYYLQSKVPGLTVSGPQPVVKWRSGTPAMFFNEMQVSIDELKNTSMSDIAMIKVYRPPFFAAPGGGSSGAIAIYTKKGADLRITKGLGSAKITGYNSIKQFYSPDYAVNSAENLDEDLRTTLYWNPMIITDRYNNVISLRFYNNDIGKRIRIVLEGINTEGKLIRIEKVLE